MTFDELVQEVYNLTDRPDKEALTKSAVKAATIKAHHSDYYSKDIYETGIAFDSAAYIQQLDCFSFVPNFRTLKYLRRVSDASDTNGVFFEVVKPEQVLDSYNQACTDIAYVAGRVLEIRAAVSFQYALFGCYVTPIVTEAEFSSWVADLHPFTIVYEAARVIFKTIGYDEEAATYNQLVAEEYRLLRMSGLTDVGS